MGGSGKCGFRNRIHNYNVTPILKMQVTQMGDSVPRPEVGVAGDPDGWPRLGFPDLLRFQSAPLRVEVIPLVGPCWGGRFED